MYLNRLILKGVRSFDRQIPPGGEGFHDAATRRLLLKGANGSGKTTVLETVALLWQQFGEWLDRGTRTSLPPSLVVPFRKSFLANADLAAMEIAEPSLGDRPLWIGVGRRDAWDQLKRRHPNGQFAGAIRGGGWTYELPEGPWQDLRQQSLVGKTSSPNVVFLPPEDRQLKPRRESFNTAARVTDVTDFNWLAKPKAALRFQDLVLTMKAKREEDYAEFESLVNLCLRPTGKKLLGFDDRGMLMIGGIGEGGERFEHPVDDLSSGERQMLFILSFVIAFLKPGGIAIIDEPDLHIHTAMTMQVVQMVDEVASRRRAQLIVASHSDIVWGFFSRTPEHLDLSEVHRDRSEAHR